MASGSATLLRARDTTWADSLPALLWAVSAGLLVWAFKSQPPGARAAGSAQAR